MRLLWWFLIAILVIYIYMTFDLNILLAPVDDGPKATSTSPYNFLASALNSSFKSS